MGSENQFSLSPTDHLAEGNVRSSSEAIHSMNTDDRYSAPAVHTSRTDRQIQNLFAEIEDSLENIGELIERRGDQASSLAWISFVQRTQVQLTRLFTRTYKAEVGFRTDDQGGLQ